MCQRVSYRRPVRCSRHLLAAPLLVLVLLSCPSASECDEITDFFAVNVLPDGEVEKRVYYGGVSAVETAVTQNGSDDGLRFRQLTDGKRLIQLIYGSDGRLVDCEFGRRKRRIRSFLESFKQDLSGLLSSPDFSVDPLDGRRLPGEFSWMNYTSLRGECERRHREIRRDLEIGREWKSTKGRRQGGGRVEGERTKRSLLIMPGTLWCGDMNNAENYRQLGGLLSIDKCCRTHDHCRLGIPGMTEKYGLFNLRPFTLSHCRCDRRSKRDASDALRIPGTKWCGKGFSAGRYAELGGFSRTDRCCRKHDLGCPFWIGGFEEKYGLFNWRVNTLMHCNCDERFRACLKKARTSDANLVGKLFFNVVQTQCFVLKPKRKCVRTSWWGKCEKFKMIKQAVLKDNMPY